MFPELDRVMTPVRRFSTQILKSSPASCISYNESIYCLCNIRSSFTLCVCVCVSSMSLVTFLLLSMKLTDLLKEIFNIITGGI